MLKRRSATDTSALRHIVNLMTELRKVQELLDFALDHYDDAGVSISMNVRRAQRIAALRRDYVNQLWLQVEQSDFTVGKGVDPASQKIRDQLDTLVGPEEATRSVVQAYLKFQRNRNFKDENGQELQHAYSVGQIERELALINKVYDDHKIPENLTQIDTYFAAQSIESGKAKLIPQLQMLPGILERIKSSVHTFLVATEAELNQGQWESPLFLRAQRYIDESLQTLAPEALLSFQGARDRLYDGGPEELSQALTSCRRMIKAIADALYPPTNEVITGDDGRDRTMSDDAYRNRLVQYVKDKVGKHKEGDVLQKLLDELGSRLNSLDSLASKGVHTDVSVREAETCVLWTYMLAGDLVRIEDGSSAHLQPTSEDDE